MSEIMTQTAKIIEQWKQRNNVSITDDALNDLLAAMSALVVESEDDISGGISKIRAERMRQILTEGYAPDHDKVAHRNGELARAALSYLWAYCFPNMNSDTAHQIWPWGTEYFKYENRSKNLVKAGALIAAEIDRNGI